MSAHELAARAELVGVVEYLRGEGLGRVESVERLLRESVFTTVNRLLAVRVAEAVGVLPPSLAEGRSSVGFVEAVDPVVVLQSSGRSRLGDERWDGAREGRVWLMTAEVGAAWAEIVRDGTVRTGSVRGSDER